MDADMKNGDLTIPENKKINKKESDALRNSCTSKL